MKLTLRFKQYEEYVCDLTRELDMLAQLENKSPFKHYI